MAFEELGGGFDVQHVSSKTSSSTSTPVRKRRRRRVEATYLLRLEQPLPTPRDVVNALGLSFVPQLELGTTEDSAASFCRLSQSCINALDSWATKHDLHRGFTKVRIGLAHKALRDLPLLGHDPTLPHHRPHTSVSQDKRHVPEYPVHYFFYGTLASSARLERLFHLPASKIPPLQPATLFDGRIQIWAGRYRALIDEPGATVSGHAYICGSSDQEDALRTYEGDSYEVVAARLMTNGEELMGRTFRFAGFDDELTE